MKYLIICMLFVSCSIFQKSVNQVRHETNKIILSKQDSTGSTHIDSSSGSGSIQWGSTIVDSSFDKVTEEVIKEVIDSSVTHRETTRTIKEMGKKRIEQSSTIIHNDSTSKKVNQSSTVNHLQYDDSTTIIVTNKKAIARTSFLPWWIWLIVVAAISLGWWQRNPIIEFFKSKT
jgi:hypothetical protein